MEAKEKAELALKEYDSLMTDFELLKSDFAKRREELIPLEIRQKLAEFDAEVAPALATAEKTVSGKKLDVQRLVKAVGETIKSDHFMAVFIPEGFDINKDKFLGFAAAHPEAKSIMETKEASVQIRRT